MTRRDRGGIGRRRGRRRRTDDDPVDGPVDGPDPVAPPDETTAVGADPGGRAADDAAELTRQASLDQVLRQAAEARALQRDGDG